GREYPRRLLTFALDGNAKLPPSPVPSIPKPVDDPAFVVDTGKADKGRVVYQTHCSICHGSGVVASGYAPELRASQIPLAPEAFKSIVHDGALV
ncbi:cytochrome c, partial [Acinetobacter baumannii]